MIGILAAPRKGVSEVTYFQLPPLQYPFLYIFSLYFRQHLALDLGDGVKKNGEQYIVQSDKRVHP